MTGNTTTLGEVVDIINFIETKVSLFFRDPDEVDDPDLSEYDGLIHELREAILAEFKTTPGKALKNFSPDLVISSPRAVKATKMLSRKMSSPPAMEELVSY